VVRPYIEKMTRSELMALMTGGFATLAGTVLGIYMIFVGERYASFLIAASVMAAPAAFVTAKIMIPEREVPITGREFRLVVERPGRNILDAVSIGVRDGLHLALNIAAMLIAFYALIGLVNWPLEAVLGRKLQDILGLLLSPFAWCLGIDWSDAGNFGSLLGTKIVINEWVGYQQLQEMIRAEALSDRSIKIATFVLCGFANFGSIGVTLGGVGQLAPSRRSDLAELALLSMVAGALSSCLTASIAGMLL
jgi:CNT family concentrative nucleoside transporter